MRLATFNILHGRTLRDGVVDPARLAEAVRILDPDILALQEVDLAQPRSHLNDLTEVAAEAMGAVTQRFVAAIVGVPGATGAAAGGEGVPGGPAYGIALLSRYPAHHWQVLHLPRIPSRLPAYRRGPRKFVTVRDEPRAAVVGHFDTPAGPLTVANTHLSLVPGWGSWQLRRIRRELAAVPDPVVLMGDLNLGGRRPAQLTGYRALATHLTFPQTRPDRQLDHILLRGRFGRVVNSEAADLPVSDHRALLVDLEFPGPHV